MSSRYVVYCQSTAELAVQEMLREIATVTRGVNGSSQLSALDYMDDGSRIQLTVDINEEKVSYQVLHFTGSVLFYR